MGNLGNDFGIALANGNLHDAFIVHKFGYNPAVGTNIEDIWATGGVYTWLQTAVQLEAISTDTADTILGDGARKVIVEGLDANFNQVSAEISMNGTSASTATTQTFIRVHRAYVTEVGVYQSTTLTDTIQGVITIRTASAGATHITLGTVSGTRFGQSLVCRYTIPSGYTGFLKSVLVSGESSFPVNAYLFQRVNADNTSTGIRPKRLVFQVLGLEAPLNVKPYTPWKFNEKTDLWISANVATTTAEIQADMEIICVKNGVIDQWED